MVTVTVVVEEAVTVTITMVPEPEPVEEVVEHIMTSEMFKEASVVTPVATTTAGVVVLTSNTTVKIVNTKSKATTHQPPSPTKWEEVIPTAYIISLIKAEGVGRS